MKSITCNHCQKTFELAEEKIPQGKNFKFKCPNCGQINLVDKEAILASDFGEPDIFPPGAKVGLFFFEDKLWKDSVSGYLENSGYIVQAADNLQEAGSKLRLNNYCLVIIQDISGSQILLDEISLWPGYVRRQVNCILVGETENNFDPHLAFIKGVNSYLSIKNRDKISQLLKLGEEEYKKFLEPWSMVLENN